MTKPAFKNLVDVLQKRAEQNAGKTLYTYLLDGESEEEKLSYAELDQSSRHWGAFFQHANAKGERALLLYPPGLEYIRAFMGCLYGEVIPVPAYPPDPNRLQRTLPRLLSIIQDCKAKYVLTTSAIKDMAEFFFAEAPELKNLEWVSIDSLPAGLHSQWMPVNPQEKDLAFIQYTSGSTGDPKGVMLSHGNLLSNLESIRICFKHHEKSQGVIWLPPYHDMGLIGGILQPLYVGFPVTLLSPLDFLQKPFRWLSAISKYKATTSGGPNFAYDLCVKKMTPEQKAALDLSSWELAFTGAEPIQAETIRRFTEAFAGCGFKKSAFYPCYGLAEATLIVSGDEKFLDSFPSQDSSAPVSCGPFIPEQDIQIVNPESFQILKEGEVGELWIAGPNVAQGYWNKPEKNKEVFQAHTKDGQGPFLRTGDLGFLKKGHLFVSGRLKDLIIVRGAKHYPQDIELSLEKAGLPLRPGCGAVFALDSEGEEAAGVVWELDFQKKGDTSFEEIFQKIREVLAQKHEIKAHAIVLLNKGEIPKTSSGKIQRHAAKAAFLANKFENVAEWKKKSPSVSQLPEVNFFQASAIEDWLIVKLAEKISVPVTEIDPTKPFTFYGLDSKEAVVISGEMEDWLGRNLSPTLLWQYPNVRALAQFLSGGDIPTLSEKSSKDPFNEPIAIVGMSCRFPGAKNVEEYWELLEKGGDAISEVPQSRWDVEAYYDAQGLFPGKMNTRWGGFLENIDEFDARFFGISPREAARMDPQQRLLLEQSWQAFENAGIPPERMAGSQTGVFIGIGSTDYLQLQYLNFHNIDPYIGTGNAHSIAANRISYLFDFRGPSLALDTACSSSLVALHLACKSLRSGESEFALAGGVNLILKPETTIVFSQARMMSSKGRCQTFDENADGYVRSEGCAVVLLKRYSESLKDGNKILGLIRGSAVNQDGHSNGLTAPSSLAQKEVIREALRESGIKPADISYFEAHGTGTPLGDPIETESIAATLKEGREESEKCWMASVKTNIGHLEVASGLAGIIKVILALQHRKIPPHLHFKKINPHIPLDQMPLRIPLSLQDWESKGKPRYAAVNSFGFGGTNANVILQEAPEEKVDAASACSRAQVLKFSAKSEMALKLLAKQYSEFLEKNSNLEANSFIKSVNEGRSDFEQRAFLLADQRATVIEELRKFGESQASRVFQGSLSQLQKPKLCFLFTGQGSQYPGMAKKLYESESLVKNIFDRCDEILKPYLEKSLLHVLFEDGSDSVLIHETCYTQPALFVLEYALAELWRSWGIEADYVMGHSVGEYVAACYAGVMSWEDGLKLIAERARLMQSLAKDGLMAVIASSEAAVAGAISPFAAEISIAGINHDKNVVISGKKSRVEAFVKYFTNLGVATQTLTVSHAFHSPLMDPILDAFEAKAREVNFQAPKIKLVSNLKGRIFAKGEVPDAKYYREHLRSAVRFSEGIQALEKEGCELFLELGPQAHLSGMGRKCLASKNASWIWSLKPGVEDERALSEAAGKMYLKGLKPDWKKLNQYASSAPLALPHYPFEREKFWIDLQGKGRSSDLGALIHPLLGEKLDSPLAAHQFVQQIILQDFPYLKDHQVLGEIVYPATAYVEMILAGARHLWPEGRIKLKSLQIKEALFLEAKNPKEVSLLLNPETKNSLSAQIFSRELAPEKGSSWKEHGQGNVELSSALPLSVMENMSELRGKCPQRVDRDSFYEALRKRGLEYGAAFRALSEIWVGEKDALAFIRLAVDVTGSAKPYLLHPALLDAAFQLVAALLSQYPEISSVYLPSGISELDFFNAIPTEIWAHVSLPENFNPASPKLTLNLQLLDSEGRSLLKIFGLELKALDSSAAKSDSQKDAGIFYERHWLKLPELSLDNDLKGTWLFIHPHQNAQSQSIYLKINEELKKRGAEVLELKTASRPELEDFLSKAQTTVDLKGIIYSGIQNTSELEISTGLLHCLQTSLQRGKISPLFILTQNTQKVGDDCLQLPASSLWGMARSVRLEHPETRCKIIDLDESIESKLLINELYSEDSELEIALRGSDRYANRIRRMPDSQSKDSLKLRVPSAKNYRMEIAKAGTLEGLELRPLPVQEPLPEEIQIEVQASALNFSDVLKALGLYPGLGEGPIPIGIECAGKIAAVGKDVKAFKVGDEVLAVAPFAFAKRVSTRSEFVAHKPSSMTFEEAASVPIAYLTAHYALNHLGRMRRGEKVLIHAGAGGVGIAAIQLAKMAGLEVFATAGSAEKREFLKSIGVDHIFDSRSLDFAEEIQKITEGKGVDLVLNSLAGDFIPKSISVLGAYGRFLEIGKIDIYQNSKIGLLPFQNNLSYFAIDLDRVLREKPDWIRVFFDELMGYFKQKSLAALPHTDFPIEDAAQAFRYMAQRKNTGKVVIRLKEDSKKNSVDQEALNSEEVCLITGGLGDLGLQIMSSLYEQGWRRFALLGRSEPSEKAKENIRSFESKGSEIRIYLADVSQKPDLEKCLEKIRKEWGPLAGIIHAAGVLEDSVLLKQSDLSFAKVFAPKVLGAWNLHELSTQDALKFFVLFSSLASMLGSPGQSNYAAANAFMDSLAQMRKQNGLPALSIHWGPWAEVGMAARAQEKAAQSAKGLKPLPLAKAIEAFEKALQLKLTGEIGIWEVDWIEWSKILPSYLSRTLLSELVDSSASQKNKDSEGKSRAQILNLQGEARKEALQELIRARVAKVLAIEPEALALEQALNSLGLDSLMAIEMKNDIENSLEIPLSIAFLLKGPSISQLAAHLAEQMNQAKPQVAEASVTESFSPASA